jgi:hypothetical protein
LPRRRRRGQPSPSGQRRPRAANRPGPLRIRVADAVWGGWEFSCVTISASANSPACPTCGYISRKGPRLKSPANRALKRLAQPDIGTSEHPGLVRLLVR